MPDLAICAHEVSKSFGDKQVNDQTSCQHACHSSITINLYTTTLPKGMHV